MFSVLGVYFFFFFNDTATTEIYTLSLHDALPISCSLSMARDWLVSWVTFSSTVMRCTRSAARCSAGKAGFRYGDRKSTRLNSSHDQISYAVFCLKKKKK